MHENFIDHKVEIQNENLCCGPLGCSAVCSGKHFEIIQENKPEEDKVNRFFGNDVKHVSD
jgi:hypothetical protein